MIVDWLSNIDWQVRAGNARQVQMQVSRHLKTFTLTRRQSENERGYVAHTKIGRLDLTLISYGAEVEIDAGQLGRFSILQWPVSGSYVLKARGQALTVTPDMAHVISPGVPVRLIFSPDCLMLVVRMSAQGAQTLGAQIDAQNLLAANSADTLGLPVSLTRGPGTSLKRTLRYLTQEGFCGDLLSRQRALGRMTEDLYLAALKEALVRPSPLKMQADRNALAPRYVARAEAFLLENLQDTITLDDVARVSGVSAATLTAAFRAHKALSPMAWWRMQRLDRAYEALSLAGMTGDSVTTVGLTWGFNHLGRFSSAYKRRFGESPRQTLQRSKSVVQAR
jgi:AraC-like DNA-binding protein